MEKKQGVKLSVLISVVVIFAIIILIACICLSNSAQSTRKKAFATMANEVVASAEEAYDMYVSGELSLNDDEETSCLMYENIMCFTVDYLKTLGLFEDESNTYSGKVVIDASQEYVNYILCLQKGAEYNITAGARKDYSDYSGINNGGWTSDEGQTTCSCMTTE